MSIFNKRTALEPLEYPETLKFIDAINHSYWLHSEWNYMADIQDFNVNLNEKEQNIIKNTLLAISQIEVSVKTFWGKLGDHFPKPEFFDVGFTFAESEVRHQRAYKNLLEILQFKNEFGKINEIPAIQGRVDYLSKYLKNAGSDNKEIYTLTLALFSLFIENVSLFSQFAIVKSFNKEKNVLKDIDNVIQATQKEEILHALLGVYVINEVRKEYPEWFNEDFYVKIYKACKKAYLAEEKILEWIFEKGEIDYISISALKEFIKYRFNESITMIGGQKVFDIDDSKLKNLRWFIEELYAETQTDFFNKRPVTYSKKTQSITSNDLF